MISLNQYEEGGIYDVRHNREITNTNSTGLPGSEYFFHLGPNIIEGNSLVPYEISVGILRFSISLWDTP